MTIKIISKSSSFRVYNTSLILSLQQDLNLSLDIIRKMSVIQKITYQRYPYYQDKILFSEMFLHIVYENN